MLGVATYDEDDPADDYLREYAEEIGVGRDVRQDARRRVPGRARRDRPGPVLRRRRAGPHRLPALRALHGRLPARRQEHAGQELPVVRGARGRADHARAHGRRHPAARRRRATPSRASAPGAWVREQRRTQTARGRRRRRRRARHEPAAGGVQAQRLAAEALDRASASWCARTREAILAVTLPEGRARRDPPRGDHRLDLPRPRHAHRDRRLRRAPATAMSRPLHAADRRRHADHAAAEARRRGRAQPAARWRGR